MRDPVVEEIHKVREEYMKKFNYDFDAIFEDLRRKEEEEKKRGRKVVSFVDNERKRKRKCGIHGCPGHYVDRKITHTASHQGEVIIIDQVPAEVCSVCGDTLLRAETVKKIQRILQELGKPARMAPVYEYV